MINSNKGKLSGALCYLSGPMQYAEDKGVSWREYLMNNAWASGLDIDFIDPTNKPNQTASEDMGIQEELIKQEKYHELAQYVKKYRRYDLRSVDYCDFIVALIDKNIHTCGTYDEIFTAERQHKPSFFICKGGLSQLPRWMFDVIDLDDPAKGKTCNVYEDVSEVIDELIRLNNGEKEMSDEWLLLRKHIEESRIQRPK